MARIPKPQFHRGDRVRLRAPYGSLGAGASGVVLEVFWSAEQCTVDFGDGTVAVVPWRLLDLLSREFK